MIDNLVHDLQLLWKADSLIGKIWLAVVIRRAGLFALAGLIAVFGLGMANVAAFLAMQESLGAVWAAVIVAVVDVVLAFVVMLLGRSVEPGAEIELALDVRKTAIESIATEIRDVHLTLDSLGLEIRRARDTIAGFVHHPFDAAAEKLLVPAALAIIRTLRSK